MTGHQPEWKVKDKIQAYWPFHDDIAVLHYKVTMGKRIIEQTSSQQKALELLHINHMDIKK